jgi:hypothetical protein
MRLTRRSYSDPIVASQIIRNGDRVTTIGLPQGLVDDFSGLPGFLHVVVTDGAGRTVLDTNRTFCPANPAFRIRPDADAVSAFPEGCAINPFTLGAVWGIPAGWGARLASVISGPTQLADGVYTARINVTEPYQRVFGFAGDTKTVSVTVRAGQDPLPPLVAGRSAAPPAAPGTAAAADPFGARSPRPDLRALPAWAIGLQEDPGSQVTTFGAAPPRDNLTFGATIWNAGPAPLVVDGLRRFGTEILDGYQYFFDSAGRQTGFAPVGPMEWDPRAGHEHWHFADFATYRLLDAGQQVVLRSQKEGFCLANTDAVDYLVANANRRPANTSLATSCGNRNSLSVRQVLDVGNGDTYLQSIAGQSFDVTDLPNGEYFVQVIANPDNALLETDSRNNASLRMVILSGQPGNRRVSVPPVGLVRSN